MRPEDVPADLLELASGVSWEQGRLPGWPTWEEFSRRAEENLYDCKELRATHVRLTAEMLAAVVPEIQAQALEEAAVTVTREVGIVWPSQRHTDVREAASYAAEVLRANARTAREGEPVPYAARLTTKTEEPTT